nr:hypothetical protein CTI12_AA390800 [Ipomoea trifida]
MGKPSSGVVSFMGLIIVPLIEELLLIVPLKPWISTPSLLPPGTVIAAANTTVTMSAAIIEHAVAVSFIHFSPSFFKSLCSSVNTIFAVLSSLFLSDEKYGPPKEIFPCLVSDDKSKQVNKDSGTSWTCIWINFGIFIIFLSDTPEIAKHLHASASITSCVMDGEKTPVAPLIKEIRVLPYKDFTHLLVPKPGRKVERREPISVLHHAQLFSIIISHHCHEVLHKNLIACFSSIMQYSVFVEVDRGYQD